MKNNVNIKVTESELLELISALLESITLNTKEGYEAIAKSEMELYNKLIPTYTKHFPDTSCKPFVIN